MRTAQREALATPGEAVRSIVLWLPDWPVLALAREGAVDPGAPVAVFERNEVVACSAAARADGVRRGQRRRDAQARCPRLKVIPADEARDHRVFSPLVARIEEHAPGVQIVRAGLCAIKARGPARYYGGEREAAIVLLEALAELGVETARAGVADGPFTAEQAARVGTRADDPVCIVPPGAAASFLSPLPIALLDDVALGGGPEFTGLLARLGVQTLGEFAALEADRVRERFAERGIRLHALASGRDPRAVDPRTPPPDLDREIAFEPPLELADQVAFGMRVAADEFVDKLGAIDLVCTELRVELTGDRNERSERVWLHPGFFDASAVVDRVRWQLEAMQQLQGPTEGFRSGVSLVRISPERVDAASHHAPAIFGAGTEERVHHAFSRVQAMLGHRGVLTPVIGGGRWLAERQVLVPWGDRVVLAKERSRPWPGSLPDPLPASVFADPPVVEVLASMGGSVAVDERGRLQGHPSQLIEGGRRRAIEQWAGPWPISERGWDAARARRAHRFQIVDADGVAWLLVCESGRWTAEARYD